MASDFSPFRTSSSTVNRADSQTGKRTDGRASNMADNRSGGQMKNRTGSPRLDGRMDTPIKNQPTGGRDTGSGQTRSMERTNLNVSQYLSLEKGQTIHGQVTNITAKTITLLLTNGQTLTARYDNALELLIGDNTGFRIVDKDEQGILLRPLVSNRMSSSVPDTTILKALESASLPVTERNVSLVTSLLKYNMPIHTQMLTQMLGQAFRYPAISISNLVAMTHFGLPITSETTQWFENYCNLEHQLLPQFHEISTQLEDVLQGMLIETEGENSLTDAASFAKRLLTIPDNRSFPLTEESHWIEDGIPKETDFTSNISTDEKSYTVPNRFAAEQPYPASNHLVSREPIGMPISQGKTNFMATNTLSNGTVPASPEDVPQKANQTQIVPNVPSRPIPAVSNTIADPLPNHTVNGTNSALSTDTANKTESPFFSLAELTQNDHLTEDNISVGNELSPIKNGSTANETVTAKRANESNPIANALNSGKTYLKPDGSIVKDTDTGENPKAYIRENQEDNDTIPMLPKDVPDKAAHIISNKVIPDNLSHSMPTNPTNGANSVLLNDKKTLNNTPLTNRTANNTTPNDTTRNNQTGNDTTPHDTIRNNRTGNDTIPHDTIRNNRIGNDTTPHDTIRNNRIGNDTIPRDTTRNNQTGNDTIPHDTIRNNRTGNDATINVTANNKITPVISNTTESMDGITYAASDNTDHDTVHLPVTDISNDVGFASDLSNSVPAENSYNRTNSVLSNNTANKAENPFFSLAKLAQNSHLTKDSISKENDLPLIKSGFTANETVTANRANKSNPIASDLNSGKTYLKSDDSIVKNTDTGGNPEAYTVKNQEDNDTIPILPKDVPDKAATIMSNTVIPDSPSYSMSTKPTNDATATNRAGNDTTPNDTVRTNQTPNDTTVNIASGNKIAPAISNTTGSMGGITYAAPDDIPTQEERPIWNGMPAQRDMSTENTAVVERVFLPEKATEAGSEKNVQNTNNNNNDTKTTTETTLRTILKSIATRVTTIKSPVSNPAVNNPTDTSAASNKPNDILESQIESQIEPQIEKTMPESLPTEETVELSPALKDFLSLLEEWHLPSGLSLQTTPPDSENLVQVLSTILSSDTSQPRNAEGIRRILSHPFFGELTNKLLMQNWTLSPDELFKPESVRKLYGRLTAQLDALEKSLPESSQNGTRPNSISQARQNVTFMNTLNDLCTYVQLPLRLAGKETHADLYVYTNKRSAGAREDGKLSCLLHLNMSSLGLLDIRVQMESGNVRTFFYLEDKKTASLLEKHLPELDEAVARHGIPMTTQVIRQSLLSSQKTQKNETNSQKESSPFLTYLQDTDKPSPTIHRYSFDVRA